jgi:HlyD family secretion protein
MKLPFLLILVFMLLVSCQGGQETTHPTREDISESVYASGVVKSKDQYQVFSTVSGVIRQVLVAEGDVVRKGDPLVRIENETARLNTESARLAAENARLSANADKLDELKVNIDLARSRMHYDSALLARQRNLWARQIGTRVELEQKELNYQNAATAYKAAVHRYNDLKRQLRFAARQSQKTLETSQTIAADYTVRSQANGKVYSLLREAGEMVNTQSPLALIGDAEAFRLELQVDEYDIAKIKPGQRVLLHLDSYRGQAFEAKVEKINPAMNERTRSFTVEAGFVTRPPTLYPNLTAEANILIRVKKQALTIPRAYLVEESYVLNEDKQKVKVATGLKDYQKVEILSGLTAADIIVKPGP